jgi:hypothetical protein
MRHLPLRIAPQLAGCHHPPGVVLLTLARCGRRNNVVPTTYVTMQQQWQRFSALFHAGSDGLTIAVQETAKGESKLFCHQATHALTTRGSREILG